MASAYYKEQPIKDRALAESLVLCQTVELCNDLRLNKVILEGDAQVVVNTVNKEEEDWSLNGHIIEDIKAMLRGRKNWKVQYINRKGNEVAHSLAKAIVQFEHEVIWIEEGPDFIYLQVLKESICID